MRLSMRLPTLAMFMISAACISSGCGAPVEGEGTPGPDLAFLDAGKADTLSDVYDGRARISSAGIVRPEFDTEYEDEIHYDLPEEGVDLKGMWSRSDLGIPEGSWTEISVFRLSKPEGFRLRVEVPTKGVSMYVLQKTSYGSLGTSIEGATIDYGRNAAAEFVVFMGPNGVKKGQGSSTTQALFSLVPFTE